MDVGSLFIHLRDSDSDGLDKPYFKLIVASKSTNVAVSSHFGEALCLAKMTTLSINVAVRSHFGEAFMVAARLAADYRMLMAECQFSQRQSCRTS